jgi:hypothetical protein
VGYATGQTDKFQGTGVFSDIKFEREKLEDNVKMDTNKSLSGVPKVKSPAEEKEPSK